MGAYATAAKAALTIGGSIVKKRRDKREAETGSRSFSKMGKAREERKARRKERRAGRGKSGRASAGAEKVDAMKEASAAYGDFGKKQSAHYQAMADSQMAQFAPAQKVLSNTWGKGKSGYRSDKPSGGGRPDYQKAMGSVQSGEKKKEGGLRGAAAVAKRISSAPGSGRRRR